MEVNKLIKIINKAKLILLTPKSLLTFK